MATESKKTFSTMMEEVKESSASSSTSSFEVVLQDLSATINGKFGEFRQIKIDGKTYSVDNRKVVNASFFKPNSKATVSLAEGKRKDGTPGTFINTVIVELPAGVATLNR